MALENVAPPRGFEPLTGGLEGRCSIQLSYEGWAVSIVPGDDDARTQGRRHARWAERELAGADKRSLLLRNALVYLGAVG
jgi:hypothetical protein